MCRLGKVHPNKVVCNGTIEIYMDGSYFSTSKVDKPIYEFASLWQSGTDNYFSLGPFPMTPEPPIPSLLDTESVDFSEYNIFNGHGSLIYICEWRIPSACKTWDYLTDQWEDVTTGGPTAEHDIRRSALCTFEDGKVVLSGGGGGVGPASMGDVNSVMAPDGLWTTTENLVVPMKKHACVFIATNKFMTLGGDDGTSARNDAYIFNLETDTRTQVANMLNQRIGPAAGKFTTRSGREQVMVIGHEWDTLVEHYDIATDTWEDRGFRLDSNTARAKVFVLDNTFYHLGGYSADGIKSRKVFSFDERNGFTEAWNEFPDVASFKAHNVVVLQKSNNRPNCKK